MTTFEKREKFWYNVTSVGAVSKLTDLQKDMNMYDVIIIGAGIAGSSAAAKAVIQADVNGDFDIDKIHVHSESPLLCVDFNLEYVIISVRVMECEEATQLYVKDFLMSLSNNPEKNTYGVFTLHNPKNICYNYRFSIIDDVCYKERTLFHLDDCVNTVEKTAQK